MSDEPLGKLAPPEESLKKYVAESRKLKPAHVKPETLAHYREGKFCGTCRYFMKLEDGRRRLANKGLWEKLFAPKDDGSEIKPYHVGEVEQYSICEAKRNSIRSVFAPICDKYKKAWK